MWIVGGGCLTGWGRIVVPYMALGFLIVISLIDLFLDRFSLACPPVGVDIISLNPLHSVVSIIIPSVKTSVVGILGCIGIVSHQCLFRYQCLWVVPVDFAVCRVEVSYSWMFHISACCQHQCLGSNLCHLGFSCSGF